MIYAKSADSTSLLTPDISFKPISITTYPAHYLSIQPVSSYFQNDVHSTGQFVVSEYMNNTQTCKFLAMHKTLEVTQSVNLSQLDTIDLINFPKLAVSGYLSSSSTKFSMLVHVRIDNGNTAGTFICPATIDKDGGLCVEINRRVPLQDNYLFSVGDIIDITLPYIEYPCEVYTD